MAYALQLRRSRDTGVGSTTALDLDLDAVTDLEPDRETLAVLLIVREAVNDL